MAEDISTTRFRIEGMDCAGCATKVDTATRRVSGVKDVSVSVTAGTMTVQHAAGADLDSIEKRVGEMGYGIGKIGGKAPAPAKAHEHDHDHGPELHSHAALDPDKPWWQSGKARLTILCALALVAAFVFERFVPAVHPWGFVAAIAVGLIPIARRAWYGAVNGSPFSIETLMTIAAVGAIIIDASEEAAVVVVLFLVGELLEGIATGRARASIRALANLVPKTALIEENGVTREVPAESLAIGATVLVRPGDRIPADGTILSGESSIDEAPVTGESVPKRKGVGETVFAGTINHDAVLRISVTAAAADNTIARIVQLVEEAQESKAPTERFIDRFSRYYTPGVLVVGALTAIVPPLLFGGDWSEWVYKGLALLLIGCPCALVISTPAAIAAALSAGARNGLLMKGGVVLETLGRINRVAFDKTGTLTEGKPKVTDLVAVGASEGEVLALAAALETGSSHPLALAILGRAEEAGIAPAVAKDAAAIGGKGVVGIVDGKAVFLGSPRAARERAEISAKLESQIAALNDEGKTVSVLVVDDRVAGLIALRDEPRADAKAGIAALKALGAEAIMLTGDNARTATAIAGQLGMEARAELLPQDKQAIINQLRAEGFRVAKVGDGINDAPALAAADIGIAMGGGTDIALETADAAILHGRVGDVAAMMGLSRAAMSNIMQNITIALGLKAVFLVTTLLGITGLWPAILADTGATVLVTANAMRLLGWRAR